MTYNACGRLCGLLRAFAGLVGAWALVRALAGLVGAFAFCWACGRLWALLLGWPLWALLGARGLLLGLWALLLCCSFWVCGHCGRLWALVGAGFWGALAGLGWRSFWGAHGCSVCGRPWTLSVGGAGTGNLRLLLGGVFGGRLHAHVGACWAAVFNAFHGRMCALVGALLRVLWAHVGACGWKCCVRSPRVCMWELVGAQLTFGCLDVAVISTRVNGVGMFLRRAEPASTLGAWAGLGSGCVCVFFCVFPVFSRGFKVFSGGQRAPTSQGPT